MDIQSFVINVKKKKIDVVDHTKKVLAEIKKINKDNHYLLDISDDLALRQAKKIQKNPQGKLAGVPITIKDCICVKDVHSQGGSAILKGYKPPFHATAVQKLIDEGAIIVGKTNQDEFGFGSFTVNVGKGNSIPLNPVDDKRVCGGSSGGSAGITKKLDTVHVSLGESTGGSIVCPASFCGVVGLCPTYGRVSRYGLIDYANSLDKIGPIAKNVTDAALVLEVISGHDKNDSTSAQEKVPLFSSYVNRSVKNMKVGIIMDTMGKGVDEAIIKQVSVVVDTLKKNGVQVKEVNLPLTTEYGLSCYYLIAMAEASTNLAKYCGIRYGETRSLDGNFNEFFSGVRSEHFGKEAKRRIIIGTFARMAGFRDAYYLRAMKVRTKIIEEYKRLFREFDVLLSPTMPVVAPRFDEVDSLTPLQHYLMDTMTVGPNIAGLPHMSIAVHKKDDLPHGIMLIADHFQEGKIIQLGSQIEGMR